MADAGDIFRVSYAGRIFDVESAAEAELDLGGFKIERQATGSGKVIRKKTRKKWGVRNLVLVLDAAENDQEFLQDKIDNDEDEALTIELVTGISYTGVGGVEGDFSSKTGASTATVSFEGGGKLEQQ